MCGADIPQVDSIVPDLSATDVYKRQVRSGYDMDVLPSDLVPYGEEAKNLMEDLQSRNERMFLVTVLVMNTANKRQKLDNNIFQVQGIAQMCIRDRYLSGSIWDETSVQ